MSNLEPVHTDSTPPGRWELARDVIAFQFKLMLDGLRDLVLSPVSIFAALWGVFTIKDDPGRYFYQLMQYGRQTDRWINLFNAHEEEETESAAADRFVQRAEDVIRSEYEKGGVMKNLKDHTDGVIDRLQK